MIKPAVLSFGVSYKAVNVSGGDFDLQLATGGPSLIPSNSGTFQMSSPSADEFFLRAASPPSLQFFYNAGSDASSYASNIRAICSWGKHLARSGFDPVINDATTRLNDTGNGGPPNYAADPKYAMVA